MKKQMWFNEYLKSNLSKIDQSNLRKHQKHETGNWKQNMTANHI